MHTLKKPLTDVCEVLEHDQAVFKMIWKCKIQSGNGTLDGALVFPNKETENNLIYIFRQIGTEVELEAAAEEPTEEAEAVEEEDFEEPFYDAEKTPDLPFFGYRDSRDTGFLSLTLEDPVTKFAVRYAILPWST